MGENQVEGYARLLADAALQLADERAQQIIASRTQQPPTSSGEVCGVIAEASTLADWPLVMTPAQLGELLQIHPRTLERWRSNRPPEGPRARQLPGNGLWRYHRADIIEWWDSL